MTAETAVIVEPPFQQLIDRIAHGRGLACTYLQPAARPDARQARFKVVVLGLINRAAGETFDTIRSLRLEAGFGGLIVVLSFSGRESLAAQPGGEALNTPGCVYLRLPFLADEFVRLAASRLDLSSEEWSSVRRTLGADRIAKEASALRHDYENKFSLALAHLRELEKLSYFAGPDPARVERLVQGVGLHLTRAKAEQFRKDVTALLEASGRWRGFAGASDSPSARWVAIDSWLELSEAPESAAAVSLGEVFKRAGEAQAAIRSVLAEIKSLKEEAQQVISYGQQNSLS
jgi:hypothetical protein